MAAASFAAALRGCISRNPSSATRAPSVGCFLAERSLRTLSSGPERNEDPADAPASLTSPEDSLRERILRLRFPKRSATAALEKWLSDGGNLSAGELRRIATELRRAQRYKHALEITEWMINHHEDELSANDYAVRIGLISAVFGISSAEEFFQGLPSRAKSCETYTALLHVYAGARLVEKAEFLFEKMKDSGIPQSTLAFNEMMTLYISVGQAEKVPLLVDQLKNSSEPADLFTYNLWISAVASSSADIDAVRRILHEMSSHPDVDQGWRMYTKLIEMYISMGPDDAPQTMMPYDFLVILHACLENKEKIDEIWKSLKTSLKEITSRTYACVLSSYLVHGHMKEAREILDEWKREKGVYERLYCAFRRADLISAAENFSQLLSERNSELVDV